MSEAGSRRAAIAAGLEQVQRRIADAAQAAGRDPAEIGLIVVTKQHPASDIATLPGLGITRIGENKDQEASGKLADLDQLDPAVRPGLEVHFVGQLQTNKARSVVRYADVVHSLDRPRLVTALQRATAQARQAGERVDPLRVLVQVDLAKGELAGRGGVHPDEAVPLAEQVAECDQLLLTGVMAVAPMGQSAQVAFDQLATIAAKVRTVVPGATWISAGMSADLHEAVLAGATHLRVGSAILGSRPLGR